MAFIWESSGRVGRVGRNSKSLWLAARWKEGVEMGKLTKKNSSQYEQSESGNSRRMVALDGLGIQKPFSLQHPNWLLLTL